MKPEIVVVKGIKYPSISAAAKALGISRQGAQKAIREGRDLTSIVPGKKLQKGEKIAAIPITIRGVEYPSQLMAAEILGVSPPTIYKAKKRGRLHSVGLGIIGRPRND